MSHAKGPDEWSYEIEKAQERIREITDQMLDIDDELGRLGDEQTNLEQLILDLQQDIDEDSKT